MGMYGDKDNLVHPEQWKPLSQALPGARIERFHRSGTLLCWMNQNYFVSTLHNFLGAGNGQDANAQIALELQPK